MTQENGAQAEGPHVAVRCENSACPQFDTDGTIAPVNPDNHYPCQTCGRPMLVAQSS